MSVTPEGGFFTMRGYAGRGKGISAAMEDYLEMICRCAQNAGYVRIHTLAAQLNVTSPSASKMTAKLRESGLVDFEPYGLIVPTPAGWELGKALLSRHEILQHFFCALNQTESELALVEQIEHFMDHRTIQNLELLLPYLESPARFSKKGGEQPP